MNVLLNDLFFPRSQLDYFTELNSLLFSQFIFCLIFNLFVTYYKLLLNSFLYFNIIIIIISINYFSPPHQSNKQTNSNEYYIILYVRLFLIFGQVKHLALTKINSPTLLHCFSSCYSLLYYSFFASTFKNSLFLYTLTVGPRRYSVLFFFLHYDVILTLCSIEHAQR